MSPSDDAPVCNVAHSPEPAPVCTVAHSPEARPFEESVFDALGLISSQVKKAEVKIGKRSQTLTLQFALTAEQVRTLNDMASR